MQSVPTDIDQDTGLRILEAIQQQNEKFQSLQISMNLMRGDVGAVKTDMSQVRIKCEETGRRCNRIEKEHSKLSTKLRVNESDIDELFHTNEKNKDETAKISSAVQGTEDEIEKLKSEVERLEECSGYRTVGTRASRTTTPNTRAVTEALNSVAGPKCWTTDDIARAHLVGQSRDGKESP